jgi:ATP-dependent RNA helicase DHX37/DHR1
VQKDSSTGIKYATSKGVEYRAMGIQEDVFIHPSSILINGPPPEYMVYHEVVQANRIWLKGAHILLAIDPNFPLTFFCVGLTVINPAWLPSLGKPSLCTFSKPIKNSAGMDMVIPRFGPERWELPPVKADM